MSAMATAAESQRRAPYAGRKSRRVAMESIRPRSLGQSSLVIRSVVKLL